ncbi:MAG: PepSY domain-containing protein [Hyphomonas sp.]
MPRYAVRYLLAAMILLALPGAASADRGGHGRERGRDDQDRAWQARRSGTILPLETILTAVLKAYPGEVLDIELDDDDGELIYEIKVLTRRGIVLEMEVDARTGRILEIEEDD